MALFHDEPAAEAVEELLATAISKRHRLLISVVNWGEIFYSVMRDGSLELANRKAEEMAAIPIEMVPADIAQARQAAIYKATKKMSYADCFAAALAKMENAELITGDSEFKEVERDIRIHWLK